MTSTSKTNRKRRKDTPAKAGVYYVRVGEYIKIGSTSDLDARMQTYPPGSQLLAVEAGGLGLERQRQRQFAHLLAARKEWFTPGDALMAHISELSRSTAA